jgi:hypothetical protein
MSKQASSGRKFWTNSSLLASLINTVSSFSIVIVRHVELNPNQRNWDSSVVWERYFGTWVHMLSIFEMHLTYILNLKKLKLKVRTYIFTCYVLTKSFHKKSTYHVTCVKKTKFSAKNNVFHKINFLFFI